MPCCAHTQGRPRARRFLADPRFQKALEVGLGISMSTGDDFARGGRGGAGAAGAAAAAQPMEEDGDVEDDDDDDDGPPPLEARPAALRSRARAARPRGGRHAVLSSFAACMRCRRISLHLLSAPGCHVAVAPAGA